MGAVVFLLLLLGTRGPRRAGGGAGTVLNVKELNCSPLKTLSAPRDKEGLKSFIYGRTDEKPGDPKKQRKPLTSLRTGHRNALYRTQMWGFSLCPSALGTLDDLGSTHSNS